MVMKTILFDSYDDAVAYMAVIQDHHTAVQEAGQSVIKDSICPTPDGSGWMLNISDDEAAEIQGVQGGSGAVIIHEDGWVPPPSNPKDVWKDILSGTIVDQDYFVQQEDNGGE
jgi:hypothetical protein